MPNTRERCLIEGLPVNIIFSVQDLLDMGIPVDTLTLDYVGNCRLPPRTGGQLLQDECRFCPLAFRPGIDMAYRVREKLAESDLTVNK